VSGGKRGEVGHLNAKNVRVFLGRKELSPLLSVENRTLCKQSAYVFMKKSTLCNYSRSRLLMLEVKKRGRGSRKTPIPVHSGVYTLEQQEQR